MAVDLETIRKALSGVPVPDGGDLVSRDMIRALSAEAGAVRFVIEAPSADAARLLEATHDGLTVVAACDAGADLGHLHQAVPQPIPIDPQIFSDGWHGVSPRLRGDLWQPLE